MNEPRNPDHDTARRRQLGQRVKRGIVAGYIHELSERHNGAPPPEQEQLAAQAEPTEGG